MIDLIKISTDHFDYDRLTKDSNLTFFSNLNYDTGELETNKYGNSKETASFNGLNFIIFNNSNGNKLVIFGSIHKFFNNGSHNFNDFSYSNIVNTIDKLGEIFFFDINKCKIHNLEIGVNIIPPLPSKKVLKGLLSHKSKRFKSYSFDNANYYQVIHTNYFIKVYDKALQYRAKGHIIENDILRIELKYRKMSDLVITLNQKGIIDRGYILLSDLKNIDVLITLGDLLIKKWNEILYYDYTISKKKLTKYQKRELDVWQNINRWESFSNSKKHKTRKLLQNVIENNSQKLQLQVSILIQDKLKILLPKGLLFNHSETIKKVDNLTTYNNDINYNKKILFNSIYKEVNSIPFYMMAPGPEDESIVPEYSEFHKDTREIPF